MPEEFFRIHFPLSSLNCFFSRVGTGGRKTLQQFCFGVSHWDPFLWGQEGSSWDRRSQSSVLGTRNPLGCSEDAPGVADTTAETLRGLSSSVGLLVYIPLQF